MQQLLQRIEKRIIARPKAVAIRTPKCYHFGRSSFKTVRFWRTDCQKVNCPKGKRSHPGVRGCAPRNDSSFSN